jgi:hypothetical protein
MEHQKQRLWCWAATGKCVSHFYDSNSPWTQCNIAKAELGSNTCCSSPTSCDEPWHLDKTLIRTGNFVSQRSGAIQWRKIKSEILAGRIVCAFNGWDGGGGHFVSIFGIRKIGSEEARLYIFDSAPDYGELTVKYRDFKENYLGLGPWSYTFFTNKIMSGS